MSEPEIHEPVQEDVCDGVRMTYRDYLNTMKGEIESFVAEMTDSYRDCGGKDLRPELSWYLEQMGFGIHRQLEREKRARREAARVQPTNGTSHR